MNRCFVYVIIFNETSLAIFIGSSRIFLTTLMKTTKTSLVAVSIATESLTGYQSNTDKRGCIQKFPNWSPGARTANSTALCHQVQLYRYFVSQSSEFCHYNPLCCCSVSVYFCCLFRYRLSPETFRYTS
jgi:hypothetical protein